MWLTLLGFFRSWKVIAVAASIAAVLAGWAYIAHLQRSAAHAKQAERAATQQSAVDTVTAKAVDRYAAKVPQFHERANRAVDQILSAPTADQPLNREFRSGLCASGLCLDPDKPNPDSPDDIPR